MQHRITTLVIAGITAVIIAGGFTLALGIGVNSDPFGGVPQCTDSIADAGGICHGEPIAD